MFDIAFSELLVIAVVALIVIGPEKLPKVARTLGALMGRMHRYVSTVKADVKRELDAQELHKMQSDVRQTVATVTAEISQEMQQLQAPLAEAAQVAEAAVKNDASAGTP